MIHTFEFVVTKRQTDAEKAANEEQKSMHLMYRTKSKRLSKVAELIKAELEKKKILMQVEIDNFYIREIEK